MFKDSVIATFIVKNKVLCLTVLFPLVPLAVGLLSSDSFAVWITALFFGTFLALCTNLFTITLVGIIIGSLVDRYIYLLIISVIYGAIYSIYTYYYNVEKYPDFKLGYIWPIVSSYTLLFWASLSNLIKKALGVYQ